MAATVSRARVELNKVQVRYKRNIGLIMKRGNAKIQLRDYIMLEVQD